MHDSNQGENNPIGSSSAKTEKDELKKESRREYIRNYMREYRKNGKQTNENSVTKNGGMKKYSRSKRINEQLNPTPGNDLFPIDKDDHLTSILLAAHRYGHFPAGIDIISNRERFLSYTSVRELFFKELGG